MQFLMPLSPAGLCGRLTLDFTEACAADRVNVRESLFAAAFNALLQQNRHETDMPMQSPHVRCWGNNGSRISGPSLPFLTPT